MKILYNGRQTVGDLCLEMLMAMEHSVMLYVGEKNHDPTQFDVFVNVHGRKIIPMEFLNQFKYGGINLHPFLWKYKGADPVGRALDDGDELGSVGCHRMGPVVDEGELLYERFIPITNNHPFGEGMPETHEEIYRILYPIYLIVLMKGLQRCSQP